MRILLVSFVSNNRWSGMGKWSHEIAAALREAGHDVSLWFADDFPRLRGTGTLAKILFPPVLAMRLVRLRRHFDALVVHEPSGFWYAWLRRYFNDLPPMVLMCHNVESKNLRDLKAAAADGFAHVPRTTRIKAPLFRLWQSDGAIRRADHVVCLSDSDRQYVVQTLRRRECDVAVMCNGVRPDELLQPRAARPAGRAAVLFVGGWTNAKGKHLLPGLWSHVLASEPRARLTLLGTHASDEVVLDAFAPEHRSSLVNVRHVTRPDEMCAAYASHDVFLLPSISEGSPLSLLEAMAAGMPVVASRVGGIDAIVSDRVNGLLFGAKDFEAGAAGVCELLRDRNLGARLGDAGRHRAAQLTWSASAQTLLDAIARARYFRARACTPQRAGERGLGT
jgi:glycosyltransferase involved in cell wall biosynthesis